MAACCLLLFVLHLFCCCLFAARFHGSISCLLAMIPFRWVSLKKTILKKPRRVKGSCASEFFFFFFFFFFQATRLIRKRYLVPNTSTSLVCQRKERTLYIPVLGLYCQNWIPDHHWSQFWGASITFKNNLQFQSPKNKLERFWFQFRT